VSFLFSLFSVITQQFVDQFISAVDNALHLSHTNPLLQCAFVQFLFFFHQFYFANIYDAD